MLHGRTAGGADTVGAVGGVLAIGGIHSVAEDQIAVPVLRQGKVYGLITGYHQLVGAGGVGVGELVQGSGGGGAHVAVGHVVGVAGLDGHIALFGELDGELAVHEQVISAFVVGAVDVAEQVVIGVGNVVGVNLAAFAADTADVAVAAVAGAGLKDQQVGDVAGGIDIGGSVSAKLGGAELVVDTTAGGSGVEDEAVVALSNRPCVGIGAELKVGAGVVGQILTVCAHSDAAADGLDVPYGQAAAGDGGAGNGDIHGSELAAGQGSGQGLVAAVGQLGHDDELTAGGDGRCAADLVVSTHEVRILLAADRAAAAHVAVSLHGDFLGVAVAAQLAGVGHYASAGAGGLGGNLGAVAVLALQRLGHVAQGQRAVGVDLQGEGDLGVAGNEHLLGGAGAGVIQGGRGVGHILFGHVPVAVVAGLDTHVAVGIEDSNQLAVYKLVLTQILVVFLAAVVSAVDEAEQVVIGVVAGIRLAADGARAVFKAVADGGDGFGVAVAAEGAGERLYALVGAGGLGGDFGAVVVAAALGANLILKDQKLRNVAAGGGGVSTELGSGDAVVDTTAVSCGVEQEAVFAGGDCPGVGRVRKLEVGAGAVAQVLAVHAQSDAAVDGFNGPDGQAVAGDDAAGNCHIHAGELAAGEGSAHGLVGAIDQSHDDVLAGSDVGSVGDQNEAGVGDYVVRIQLAAGGAGAAHVAVGGHGDLLGVAVTTLGAGVGHYARAGAGGLGGDLRAVAVLALQILSGVAQGQRAVLVDHQREGDLGVTGDEHLLGTVGDQFAGGIVAVAFSHIPLGVVGGFYKHIAVGGEGDHQLALGKLVLTHVQIILFAAVVGAVDEANQIVVYDIVGVSGAADGTFALVEAVTRCGNRLGVAVATLGAGEGLHTRVSAGSLGGDF